MRGRGASIKGPPPQQQVRMTVEKQQRPLNSDGQPISTTFKGKKERTTLKNVKSKINPNSDKEDKQTTTIAQIKIE